VNVGMRRATRHPPRGCTGATCGPARHRGLVTGDEERGRVARSEPEVADLVRALQSGGVLTREQLRERSGAKHWARESFDIALRRGIADGSIRQLGAKLFEVGPDAPQLNEGAFDPP
jgi:hypothetical protein